MSLTLSQFAQKESKIALIGLGYVGLPLAVELNKKYDVIGFDIYQEKIDELKQCIDRTHEVSTDDLKASSIRFTTDPSTYLKHLLL